MEKQFAIAIDGPAAAGKSTVAKLVASKLTYVYIDTGAMYRALTLSALRSNLDVKNEKEIYNLLSKITIDLEQSDQGQKVLLNDEDVSLEIRTKEVTNNVSYVAEHVTVRHEMVNRQQKLAAKRGVVMDGRDIGTHVIPDAEVKVFLIASVEERAERRHKENIEKGFTSDLDQLKDEIRKRDKIDSEREYAPLIKAEDATEIDTTSLSIEEVADEILKMVNAKLK